MSRKSGWIIMVFTLVLVVALTGCGNSNSNDGAKSQTNDSSDNKGAANNSVKETESTTVTNDKPVTLRFSWWGSDNRHEATLKAIEAYKSIRPNVTIEAEYSGFDGYEQKLKTQLASVSAPDIIQIDQPWMSQLVSRGDVFVDLSQEAGFDVAQFDANFLGQYTTFDGKILGVPSGINASVLYINKTAAEREGITITPDWDWDQVIEEAKKLRSKNDKMYLFNCDCKDHGVGGFITEYTGKTNINDDYTLAFNREQAVQAFTKLGEVLAAGVYQPIGEAALFYTKPEQNPKWINEELFMIPDYISNIKRHGTTLENAEFTVSLNPTVKGSTFGASVIRPAQVFVVNKQSADTQEAVAFLNWFLNDAEAAAILGDVRGVPSSALGLQAAVDAGKVDPIVIDALELAYTSPRPTGNTIESNAELVQIFSDISLEFEYERLNAQQAADKLIERLTSKLKELQTAAQ